MISGKMNRGKKFLTYVSLISIIVAMRASTALACGVCTTAVIDRFLPPVELWCVLSIFWFFANKVVISLRCGKVAGIASFAKALLLVLGLILVGLTIIGPLGLFVLLVPAFIVTVRAFWPHPHTNWSPTTVRNLRIVGTIGLLAFVFLSFYSLYIKRVRSEAEYILKWYHTGPGRVAVNRLVRRGPEALPDLRVIVENGNEAQAATAIEGIADFGNPTTHVPFLINILESARIKKLKNHVVEQIGEALRALSGLELPRGTPPETWRHVWEEKSQKPAVKRNN